MTFSGAPNFDVDDSFDGGYLGRFIPPLPGENFVQGLLAPFARVGSGDPARVLRLFHNKYTGYNEAFIAETYVQLVATESNVLLYLWPTSVPLCYQF